MDDASNKLGKKIKYWRVCAIVVAGLAINLLLHVLVFPLHLPGNLPHSVLVQKNLVAVAAGPGMFIALLYLAISFLLVQPGLSGRRWRKGMVFGVAFIGLWILGFIEVATLSDTTWWLEIGNALPDILTIGFLIVLLSINCAWDSPVPARPWRPRIIGMGLVALAFFLRRMIGDRLFADNAMFKPEPGVFVWMAAMAIWLGVFYGMLGFKVSKGRSSLTRALYFCGIVLGINWLIFELFLPIFLALPVLAIGRRALVDLLFLFPAVWLAERMTEKYRLASE